MAVTNTVQGLNCVIDLLKNILDATKSNDDKAVQPKDISTTTKTAANIVNAAPQINGLSQLNSVSKSTENSAHVYANVINIITSKDVISGINKLILLNKGGMLKHLDSIMETIINAINKIDDLKVSPQQAKTFATVLNTIGSVVQTMTNVIKSLGNVMLSAAGLGLLFIVAWPLILVGFAGITLTMLGVLSIVKFMTFIQGILFGTNIAGAVNPGKGITSGIQVLLFKQMVEIFLSLSVIILVAAGVGLLSQYAFKQILIGFGVITLVIGAILVLTAFIKYAVQYIMGMTKGVGRSSGNLGFLSAGDKKGMMTTMMSVGVIAAMTVIMFAIAGLIVIAATLGLLAQIAWKQILIGFGAISLVIVAIVGIMWGIKKAVDWIMKDKTSIGNVMGVGNSMELLKTVGSVALLVVTMLAISLLVIVSAAVGAIAMEYYTQIGAGVAAIGIMLVGVMIILRALSNMTRNINIKQTLKSIGLLSLLIVVISMTSLVMIVIAKVATAVNDAGGWGNVWTVLANVAGVIVSMSVLIIAIGALTKIPGIDAIIYTGLGIIAGISLVLFVLSKAIRNFVDTAILIGEAKDKNAFDGIIWASAKIGLAISAMTTALMPAAAMSMSLIPALIPLNLLMSTISKFVNIISRVGNDPNFITPVQLDENGNIISTGEKANIGQIAQNIANSFKIFIETLVPAFDDISMRGVRRMARSAKKLNKILDPISKFADIISKIGNDPNFIAMIDTKELDSNGETKVTKHVKVLEISKNISSAFSTFVSTLALELENIETSNVKKFKKLAKGEGIIGLISGFMEIFTKYRVSDDGKTLYTKDDNGKEIPNTISSVGIAKMIKDLNTEFGKIEYGKIQEFAEDFADINISSSSIWSILNTVEMFNENESTLEKNTANIKLFTEEWTKLDNIMFKDSDKKLQALREYKKVMEELRDVLKTMSESTEKISNMKLPGVPDNLHNDAPSSYKNVPQQPQTIVTAVDAQNNNAINNNSFNPSDIADAIKTGLSGSVVKFTFNDSTEDFIADMMLT